MQRTHMYISFFFFNDTATTEIYTLSLHDALPISGECVRLADKAFDQFAGIQCDGADAERTGDLRHETAELVFRHRSEEHTSELQSQSNLVCRLLLEKKKTSIHADNTTTSRPVSTT